MGVEIGVRVRIRIRIRVRVRIGVRIRGRVRIRVRVRVRIRVRVRPQLTYETAVVVVALWARGQRHACCNGARKNVRIRHTRIHRRCSRPRTAKHLDGRKGQG